MVLYFSGTGNSKYIAQSIAEALNDELFNINERIKEGNTTSVQTGENVILVTPTYAWRIPRVVSDWLTQTTLSNAQRIWFVMDCGSEIGNAAKYNQSLATQKSIEYRAQPKSSCLKTTLQCFLHLIRQKQGQSLTRQSSIFRM